MATVRVGKNESTESAIRRFKKLVQKEGILEEMAYREYYRKPSVERRQEEAAARRRIEKANKKFAKK